MHECPTRADTNENVVMTFRGADTKIVVAASEAILAEGYGAAIPS